MITSDSRNIFLFLRCDECPAELGPFSTMEEMEKCAKQKKWMKYYYAPVGTHVLATARHYCNNPCKPDSIINRYGERVF